MRLKAESALKSYRSAIDEFEGEHVKPKLGRTLIVGSHVYKSKEDRRTRYADAVGVDMLDGPGVDIVADLEDALPDGLGLFDHVECLSVLEHSKRPWLLAENVERLMAPGGTIFVRVPFVWRVHGYPNDYWRMTTEAIRSIFTGVEWLTMRYGHGSLTESAKIPILTQNENKYFARTESCGFGVKRAGI